MQTELILTKETSSTVQVYILDNADEEFSLESFVSAVFAIRASQEGDILLRKSTGDPLTTSTAEPELSIHDTYVEMEISPEDTQDLSIGKYLADVVFTNSLGKQFATDTFYVEIKARISE